MQKLAEEKKAEALKHMNSLPQVELDLKRHGPDGYHGGCREGRGLAQSNMARHQHPKQVRLEAVDKIHYTNTTVEKQQAAGPMCCINNH